LHHHRYGKDKYSKETKYHNDKYYDDYTRKVKYGYTHDKYAKYDDKYAKYGYKHGGDK
jgi:hypothetical protein